jgi:hypothetical protein
VATTVALVGNNAPFIFTVKIVEIFIALRESHFGW